MPCFTVVSRIAGPLCLAGSLSVAPAIAATPVPNPVPMYSSSYSDAVTGWNCTGMSVSGGCTGTGWSVTPGADVYASDVYERPTSQTYTGTGQPVASEYLGYLDLTTAKYGYNDQYMFFQLNVFSPYLYKNDGTVDTGVFGSGTYYGVQLGSTSGNDGQLLLRAEQTKDTLGATSFDSSKAQGWYDTNNSVSGPGGVGTPNEEDVIPNFNGYEFDVISTDGYLNGTSSFVLFSRSFVNGDGTVSVEMAFDYRAYNLYCGTSTQACADLDPGNLPYLVFETTRGLKDNQNYLWNDKYSSSEAGTPYTTAGLGNIYELDNMRVAVAIPEPSTYALMLAGLAAIGFIARRRQRV